MKDLRLGVVGTNFVSDWLCEAAASVEGIVCEAVYSRRQESGRAFADRHGIRRVFCDWEAFLSSGIEAVYIASPNGCHFEQAMAALENGLHVLCEKPLTPGLNDFLILKKAAKAKGAVLLEAMRPAHDPAFALVKKNIPRLGRLRRATLEYCQYSSRYDRFKAGEVLNAFDPSLSNAALLDIGIYPLFWCIGLFGKPCAVTASSLFLPNGMEGQGSVLLSYEGFQVSVIYSKIVDSLTPSVFLGEAGSITLDKLQKPERIVFYPRKGEEEVLFCESAANNLVYEVKDFLQLIREGGESPYLTVTEDTLCVVEEIKRQAGIRFG